MTVLRKLVTKKLREPVPTSGYLCAAGIVLFALGHLWLPYDRNPPPGAAMSPTAAALAGTLVTGGLVLQRREAGVWPFDHPKAVRLQRIVLSNSLYIIVTVGLAVVLAAAVLVILFAV
jgi:hypothetical protein